MARRVRRKLLLIVLRTILGDEEGANFISIRYGRNFRALTSFLCHYVGNEFASIGPWRVKSERKTTWISSENMERID